ncbi:15819_t:CDS:2 [Racocetra persica]|uniref:15819_t:CDS:1 n=1 Tax=Racocetra persica TaxID=160502 RepID=A0ACA9KE35_9GLOM|nr:15819_t:CDS:2 [Racocetra persica]
MTKKHDIISKPDVREHERLLDFRRVRKSLARLKSSFNELDTIAKQNKPKGIFISIHPRFNNIVVVVTWPPDQHSRALIETARRLGADIYSPFKDTTPLTKRGPGKMHMSAVGGESGGPAYYFSDFSNLRLVTIAGIFTASLKHQDIPLYPFGVVFPKEIILDSFQLDLITKF